MMARNWRPVQVPDIGHFRDHAGQWWVYDGDSPLVGYQGPPLSKEDAWLISEAPRLLEAAREVLASAAPESVGSMAVSKRALEELAAAVRDAEP